MLYRENPDHPHWRDESHLWHQSFSSVGHMMKNAGMKLLRVHAGTGVTWLEEQYAHPENLVAWGVKL